MTIDLNALKAEAENWRDGPGAKADTRVRLGDLLALVEVVEAGQLVIATENAMRLALADHAGGIGDRRRFAHNAAHNAMQRLGAALAPFNAA